MLPSKAEYARLVYSLEEHFPTIERSSLPKTGPNLSPPPTRPPDIKRHREPAPGLSFTQPNLHFLIREIEDKLLSA